MKTNYKTSTSDDIDNYVYDILKQSKSFDIYPTPIEKIVEYAELIIDKDHGLHNVPNHYLSKKLDVLVSALKKVYGALDRRKKIIYLNPDLSNGKKAFVQLHEVGHHVLPWQRDIYEYLEDDESLSPDVVEQFEAEANQFASASLFQLSRFEHEASVLPLNLSTIKYLASKFGASLQATFRRYVEKSDKRVALLVLSKPESFGASLKIRNWITSKKFLRAFSEEIEFPEFLSQEWPFIKDYYCNRIWLDDPQTFTCQLQNEKIELEYRYFNNRHNIFVLITPKGEKISSKTKIIINEV